ncbi:hypothetical protein FNT36_18305 [Hymenobacter setariae]|uniref:Uncharacterized protein n=1 Tax=Hymenobacter setariae TaxID=2594794 RepID=A0A558BSY0_9BACT|nr:hypothetical protein [Hymenobacter setariae]TVT39595.1 hypothetical protein FNT36_18305 [Hymenobacter setariae]
MKHVFLWGSLLSLAVACEPQPTRQPAAASPAPHPSAKPIARVRIPEGTVQGDFDGDGTAEYVWLVPPEVDSTEVNCVGGACTSYLTSSNPALRPYALETAIGGTLTVYHHLGASQRDYVGIAPEWFMGCWSRYFVLTYRPGGWQLGVDPFSTHCDQWEQDTVAIARDSAHPGHVLIHYTDMAAEDFTVRTKSVPLR